MANEASANSPATKPPSGLVTFFFTDIVGSTEMWERHGDAFLPVLQAHNAIIADAIRRNGGYLIKTEGDAYKAAFSDPGAAVKCAIVAQAALQRYPWPADVGPLQVRMAVHSGRPFAQSGDYFGPPVNRTARMLSASSGAQVLISEDALNIAESRVDTGTRFVDLGYHRLKDLDEPIRLYQVDHAAMARSTPGAPRSLNAHPNNLPVQRTSFIGRDAEIAHIASALSREDTPVLQLTGPSGVGKTRLSLQVAAERADWFADGVWYVQLGSASTAEEAASEVARTLGIRVPHGAGPTEAVREWLANRSCLLILDDCGRVSEAGQFIRELLSGAGHLRCLATSSERLHLDDAPAITVPELSLPTADASPKELMASEAGRLFVERAREARSDFRVTDERAKPIVRLLSRLGGMPASIERAAEALRNREATPGKVLADLGRELAQTADEAGHLAAAKGREVLARLGDYAGTATVLGRIGAAFADSAEIDEAEAASRRSLRVYERLGDDAGVARCLHQMGLLAYVRRDFRRAVVLLLAAYDTYSALGSVDARSVAKDLAAARQELGRETEPLPLSREQAVAYAYESEG